MINDYAFPTNFKQLINHDSNGNPIYVEDTFPGMTLRDYFAAKAIQGLLAQSLGTALGSDPESGAIYAYRMADAMLAERGKAK